MNAETFIMLILFLYMPCHFLEEAHGNFPDWMYHHWTPMHLSYGHWMANNIFLFYPILVISYLLYYFLPDQCLCFGMALLVWGYINAGDHIFYTIKDKKISPGLFTGFLYIIDATQGFRILAISDKITVLNLSLSIFIGSLLFATPCYLSKVCGPHFMRKFGTYKE